MKISALIWRQMNMDILGFYNKATEYIINHGFAHEISMVRTREFKNLTARYFLEEYVYVVCNAGMRNQVAEKIYMKWIKFGSDTLNHKGKRAAIELAEGNYTDWFIKLKSCKDLNEQLDYLQTLPWIGPITKYHLARNLGVDVAKPDRHLVKLAKRFEFDTVQEMCESISKQTNERVGVIDVILWRYCNLTN